MIHIEYDDSGFMGKNKSRPVIRQGSITSWENTRRAIARGGLNEPDVERVLSYLVEYLAWQLGHGGRVRTPLGLFELSCGISGVLRRDRRSPKVRPEDLRLVLKPERTLMRDIRGGVEIEYHRFRPLQHPTVRTVTLFGETEELYVEATGITVHTDGSRSGVLALTGGSLSFKARDPELGLFLQPLGAEQEWPRSFEGAPSERAVPEGERRIEIYPHIGSSKLQALLPAGLPPGRYGLLLVTRPPKCRLRVVKTGVVVEVGGDSV